jgi:hypothetical protein
MPLSFPAVVELANQLSAQRELLLKQWMKDVHEDTNIQASEMVTARELRDHMPQMFDDLVARLRDSGGQSVASAERHAQSHGYYRLTQGYDLAELLQEIAVARLIFIDHLLAFEGGRPAFGGEAKRFALRTIHAFFDDFARESVKRFVDEQQAEVQHLSASRLRLLRTVSHELRNPVNSLSLAVQALADETEEEPRRKSLTILRRNIDHLVELLNRLLDFSKFIDAQFTVVLAPFDPHEFANDLAAIYLPLSRNTGLTFEASVDPALGTHLVSDVTKLRQTADNLLSNAFKYTEAGRVHLLLRAASDGAHWLLVVEDSGRGIPVEAQANLFNEFYRVPGTEHLPGTGLGLAITRRLVDLLGGSIRVESTPGQGSRFEVKLPRLREPPPAETAKP